MAVRRYREFSVKDRVRYWIGLPLGVLFVTATAVARINALQWVLFLIGLFLVVLLRDVLVAISVAIWLRQRYEMPEPDRGPVRQGFNAGLLWSVVIWSVMSSAAYVIALIPGHYRNLLGVAVLPTGYAAFRLKKTHQYRYGQVEVVIGIATALGVTLKDDGLSPAQGLALVGAMYVVARGFSNINEANRI